MQNILSRKHFELNMCYPKLETVVPNLKTAFLTLPEAFQRYSQLCWKCSEFCDSLFAQHLATAKWDSFLWKKMSISYRYNDIIFA